MYDGQIIADHRPMTSRTNDLSQTLSSAARRKEGRPILPDLGRVGGGQLIQLTA